MNILQINTADTRGGAAKVAYNLKVQLEKNGHQTSMFVGEKFSQDKNVFILNNKKNWAGRIRKKLAYWLANDIDVFSSDKILKTEAFQKADLIHCHNLHSYFFNLATLEKIAKLKPVIWTFHDMWPITSHCAHAFSGEVKDGFFQCPSLDIFPPLAWHNEKYLEKKKANIYKKSIFHITVPSVWLKEKVTQSLLADRPINLIYNGINTNIFKPQPSIECRQALDLPLDKKIVLSVIKKSQSNLWKGADYLPAVRQAFQARTDVFFVCLGGSNDPPTQSVRYIPYVRGELELAKYYGAADILLYPSIADNCPLVVLEAQGSSLPVVAFKTGGIPELISHGITGYLAKYKDTRDLVKGVEFVLNLSEEALQTMKKNAHQRVRENFSMEGMFNQYLELYQKLLAK